MLRAWPRNPHLPPERVPTFMRRAFALLRSGRPGPVILTIPNATSIYDDTADP
jgi:thiamine pyrophosphate-dependent acetolactate synthase large subunit-like protein